MYRGGGSIGVNGAARSVLLVATDPEDETRRVLASVKSNLAPEAASLAFRLVGDPAYNVARIQWEGPTDHRANDLVAMTATDEERGARQEASDLLRELLGKAR
jgi:hypothetical protein